MMPRTLLDDFGWGRPLLVLLACLCPLAAHAAPVPQQEQQQQQQEQKPPENAQPVVPAPPSTEPAPKKRKIWTNDEVIELRTPADVYLADKDARDAAQAEAVKRSKETKPEKQDPQEPLPLTAEETQAQITSRERLVAYERNRLDEMRAALGDAPADQQLAKLKEIDAVASNLEQIQARLTRLQDHLKRLQSRPAEKPAPSAPPPLAPSPARVTPPSPTNPE